MRNLPKEILYSLLALAIFAALASSGCSESSDSVKGLKIAEMDLSAEEVTGATVTINVTTYVENQGRLTSKNASLLLKAYETKNNLLETQVRSDMGPIERGTTANITNTLELPKKGSYRIEATLFEEDEKRSTASRTVYNLESLTADVDVMNVRIGGMDFMVKEAENGTVRIQTDIYFTNVGPTPSPDYRIEVKAREVDSGLVADKKEMNIGEIPPQGTVIRSVNLSVPDQYNYRAEVLIWRNASIVGQGEDYVLLKPEMMMEEGQRIESKDIKTKGFVMQEAPVEEAAAEMEASPMEVEEYAREESPEVEGGGIPGFGILLAAISVALTALHRRRMRGL
ncbi:MAG TPA: hypothetical protein PLQ49_08360 [Methanothrix sp.]|nr:hypothetical protein [Methanothrix sp.]HRW83593.1 hypothetical protein [Methanothrix sp.]